MGSVGRAQFQTQPAFGIDPVGIRRRGGHAEGLGRLFNGQAGKITQLDELGSDRIDPLQLGKRLMNG